MLGPPIFGSSGYLTPAYDPFAVAGDPNQASFRVSNLTPPDRVTLDRLRRRPPPHPPRRILRPAAAVETSAQDFAFVAIPAAALSNRSFQ